MKRRVLKVLKWVALVTLLLVVCVPLVGWLWLQSGAGREFVKTKALAVLTEALPGRFELGALKVTGSGVHLEHVKLFTPEGELVIEVDVLDADLELLALSDQVVNLRRLSLERPKVFLVNDEQGLNLVRAFKAKALPGAAPSAPVRWRVTIGELALTDGTVDYRDQDRNVAVQHLGARGNGKLAIETLAFDAQLTLAGVVTSPVQGPLTATLKVDSAGPVTVLLGLNEVSLQASGDVPSHALRIEKLVAPPKTMKAFVPSWPLLVPVELTGSLSETAAQLEATAGSAALSMKAAWALEADAVRSVSALEVKVKELDFKQLLGASQASRLSFSLTGALSDARLESLDGNLGVEASWRANEGRALATLNGQVLAKQGETSVKHLRLQAPEATLELDGQASLKQLGLRGALDATDLSLIPATVSAFAGVELPALSGAGALQLEATGPTLHPRLTAHGQLRTLRVASLTAERLDLDANLPDATRPLDTDLHVHAQRVTLGVTASDPGRVFDEVSVNVVTHGRDLQLEFATKGLGDLKVLAGALLDADSNGARLNAFALTANTWAWSLDEPSHVSWLGSDVVVDPLSLHDGVQHLAISARQRGRRLAATLTLEQVDLAKLPHVLVPERFGLEGELFVAAKTDGLLPRPDTSVHFSLKQGALAGLQRLEASGDVGWKKEHLTGSLALTSSQGSADANFDLPLIAVLDEKEVPLQAQVSARGIDLKQLESLTAQPLGASGLVSAQVVASGTGAHPKVTVELASPQLLVAANTRTGKPVEVSEAKLVAQTREDDKLEATLTGQLFEGQVKATLHSPFTLSSLRAHLPTAAELKLTPVSVEVEASGLNAHAFDTLQLVDAEDLGGKLGVTGTVDGSLDDPRAHLTFTAQQLVWPPVKNVDLSVKLEGLEHETSALVTVTPAGLTPFEVLAKMPVNLRDLQHVEALGSRRISVESKIQPFELREVVKVEEGETPPSGRASATLSIEGTLDEPQLHLLAAIQDLHIDKASLGSARLQFDGTGATQKLALAIGGVGAEDLKIKGTFGLPLSWSKLRAGTSFEGSSVNLEVVSRDLDLAFLSGIQPMVRVVGGRLKMQGAVTGTLGDPKFVGDAHWKGGRLALMGYGDYRSIELDVKATNDLVDVSKLTLHSGSGSADLKGTLDRQADGFHLIINGTSDKLPIIIDDQLMAMVSTNLALAGDLSPTLIDITSIDLSRVDVELPDVKRKDLQDLQRPGDIVVLKAGNRAFKKRQAAKNSKPAPPSRGLRVTINAPRNIWVRSSDLNIELGLSEGFHLESNETTQLFGEATILRGDVSVIGRKFTVQKGSSVRFAGPAAQPQVNVAALHINEKEKVKVTVTAIGRGTDVALKATSEPPMAESDIYTLLATGRLKLERGSGSALTPEDAVSVVGQLAAAQVKTMLAKKLPIDVLNFEALDNFQNFKFDVGKYLSDSVYLGVTAQTGANPARGENPWAGRLELQMSKSWSLEAYAGTAPAAGADVIWSRDF